MWTAFSLCALLFVGPQAAQNPTPAAESSTRTTTLPELIATYLDTHDAKERRGLIGEIATAADGQLPAVITALRSAQLWKPVKPAEGSRPLVLPSGGVIEVHYRVPPAYDGVTAFPLILLASDGDATQKLKQFVAHLGDRADRYIVACPERWPGAAFHHPPKEAVEFREMVVALRRAFHTNTDRWYLCGQGEAGDAAWLTAILHRDIFAGLFVTDAYPKMPHAEHLFPILLPNLADTRVLSVWQRPSPDDAAPRSKAVAAHNHAVLDLARLRFVRLTGVEKPSTNGEPPWPSPEKLDELLSSRRPATADRGVHWFRYEGQGQVGPLTQTQYRGDAWTASQLAILPGPSIDRDTYVSDVLKEHLAYLEYRRDGNTYRLATRKSARVTLRIPYGQLNTEQPITVYCNGAVRHDKPTPPSLRTLLENAYNTWDFERPVSAEISFSIRRDQP